MKKLAIWSAVTVLILLGACSDNEPTMTAAEEAELRAKVLQRIDPVGQFPIVVENEIMPALEELSPRSVGDVQGAVRAIQLFDRAERAISLTKDATLDPKTTELRLSLIALLRRRQVELFPTMRQSYAGHMSEAVQGTQANFRAIGDRRKTLRGASPSFTSPDIIMQAHQSLVSQATRFRFSRAEYIYSATGEHDYVTIHGRADDDIAE